MATTGISQHAPAPAPCPPGASSRASPRAHQRHKPRKFSTFMKRLMKSSSSSSSANGGSAPSRSKSSTTVSSSGAHRSASFSHGHSRANPAAPSQSLSRSSSNGHLSFAPHQIPSALASTETFSTTSSLSFTSSHVSLTGDGTHDSDEDHDHHHHHHHLLLHRDPTIASTKSRPPPSATTATSNTSRFSSPSHSVRSLTTTLTTIQSTAPGSILYNPHPAHHHNPYAPPVMYSTPFPATPNPALLHPGDDASIMTLASSSKRRRRHSADTDASVRALPPSSVWGGSRESLPLSLLSGGGRSMGGERGSLYGSVNGVSIIGEMNATGSAPNSITGVPGNPAAPPGSSLFRAPGNHSRMSSGLGIEFAVGSGSSGASVNGTGDATPVVLGDVDADADRRSWSVRSASLRDEERCEVASVKDGSSNIGVWNGVVGKVRCAAHGGGDRKDRE